MTPKVLQHAKKRVLRRADTVLLTKLSLLYINVYALYTNLYSKCSIYIIMRYGFEKIRILIYS